MGYDIEVIRLPTQLPVRMAHLFSLLNGDGDGPFRQINRTYSGKYPWWQNTLILLT